ncbi:transcription-repair coupling factor [Aliidiomarina maris]|uniref:Transcription-repair-coupling factor n=1 Tax=Aliidiomarina maris TaxID=531312 RepID=A0A327X637_9GAMM|nr:transcription-repair coupling factor [Aliidiomarina maris]RAK01544.1 transcription-repair coupling factor [Aliidiomarina maris]RUO28379.1 transcription-repair coupling factor [Aliidiomarina maris]
MAATSPFNVVAVPAQQQDTTWRDLHGSSSALALAKLAEQQPRRILLITEDAPTAYRLEQEIRFFTPALAEHVSVFPDWETLPYDNFSPHQDIISERLRVLAKLPESQQGVLIVSLNSLLHRIAPPSYVQGQAFILAKGEHKPLETFRRQLEQAGYRAVNQVMEHGEYSVRGSIMDLYPMGSDQPFRIDYFDDEIDSIRPFDVETQRSESPIDSVQLLPAHEFPTNEAGIEVFRRQFRERFEAQTARESIYQQVSQGSWPAGIEYYLPLFFEQTATLFDYLPDDVLLVTQGDLQHHLQRLWHDIEYRYEDRRWDKNRPLLEPGLLFMRAETLNAELKSRPRIRIHTPEGTRQPGPVNFNTKAVTGIQIEHKASEPLAALKALHDKALRQGERVLFTVESKGRRESLLELLGRVRIHPQVVNNFAEFLDSDMTCAIVTSSVAHSFFAKDDNQKIWVLTEAELLGAKITQRRRQDKRQNNNADAMIKNLAELSIGQPVVHLDHGVGRYQGLTTINAAGTDTEFVSIEYAQKAKLFVPVAALHLISRYSGGESDHAPLNKLGNDSWEKAKQKAAEKVRDVAAELLAVYAKRESRPGYAFQVNDADHARFADGFGFTETDDQMQAIQAVLDDMRAPRAMDRLVCGDVGFGKTEVAMRAAFTAVNDNKQVAVLVPTTLLAQQHYENFRDRFADWPVRVEVLSRFRTAKQTNAVLQDLADGKVDIVIGTHKLLQNDIVFKDLGLLVVDEEHRFGVRQKEKIKRLRAEVDILTLTATPIPRTLNMAMNGIRDLSIISTPPAKRLAVKTFVREFDKATVREAILRETLRGGQVYFLHNNVESIDKTAAMLAELVPEARITTAHGQMNERELERIMADFYHQRFNVLVCTTIIETGIDIPTANTIIMDRADHLGLAQLHQLRGRVGRSHHQAYAYLLTPHPKRMTKDAVKRLEAIAQLEDLGAGFVLATHDLEIRGAGELLGDDQSGQIESIGFSLYMDMLDEAVKALKEGKEPSIDLLLRQQTEIELRIPALLPSDYIADVNTRLSLYKRIAGAESEAALEDLQIEMIDRFGLLPDAAKHLIRISELRLLAAPIGVRKIEVGPQGGHIEFNQNANIDPSRIITMLQREPQVFAMDGPTRLKVKSGVEDTHSRIKLIQSVLQELRAA